MSEFCNSPMPSEFNHQGKIPEGGPGVYNGEDCPPFDQHKRTSSPNSVKEKNYDGSIEKPSGEPDHF